jgi:hypothetical protein
MRLSTQFFAAAARSGGYPQHRESLALAMATD